jgi:xanthine dehydrogenase accessory factor
LKNVLVLIKGAGDLASGVAHRLYKCGFTPVMTELHKPLVVRRKVSFAEAVYTGETIVEGIRAVLCSSISDISSLLEKGIIPVFIDPRGELVHILKPDVLVDAVMAKRNTGTKITDAHVVIALGPGFIAGVDAYAVIETKRGHELGRVILDGTPQKDTGEPHPVEGYTYQRLIKAPQEGIFGSCCSIGEIVENGQIIGYIEGNQVQTQIKGVLRGLVADGCIVKKGMKIGDVDPRCKPEYCCTISDKARAVAGGVLEAMLDRVLDRVLSKKVPGGAGFVN